MKTLHRKCQPHNSLGSENVQVVSRAIGAKFGAEHTLQLTDNVVCATAVAVDRFVWTQDVDFGGLPGVKYSAKAGDVIDHYGVASLGARINDALTCAGFGDGAVSWMDLAPLDQFHVRGLAASRELADAMSLAASASVLDIGCGVGGASRFLAATYGARVTGIDLTPSFIEAATMLSARAGLSDTTHFAVADAIHLPYGHASFDYAWTQHVAMNISNRWALYNETHRVLRPGGLFGIHDIAQGPGGAIQFPVPWAREQAMSHLLTPDAMRETLTQSGFEIVSWLDTTEATRTWIEKLRSHRNPANPPSALGLGVITGPDLPEMIANLGRNIAEARARVIQVVARA